MSPARLEELRRLAEWEPPLGVVSVYLAFDPADRGGAWRTELRNGLSSVVNDGGERDHDAETALRATVERVSERFANHERSLPRAEVGFVEVAAKPGAESWWSSHVAPEPETPVSYGPRALIGPLVDVLERGAAVGAAILSGERVRLLEWAPGRVEELHNWELTVFSRDWRERKALRMPNPARAQTISSSGRDQFDERLEENRHRFLGECGGLAARTAAERGWRELLLFGAPEHRREFESGVAASDLAVRAGGDSDLISEQPGRLAQPIGAVVRELEEARERQLAERAIGAAQGGMRGSAGLQETEAALAEGRVECLVFDASQAPRFEELVRRSLASGADLAAVSGPGAEMLAEVEGVAAVLRY